MCFISEAYAILEIYQILHLSFLINKLEGHLKPTYDTKIIFSYKKKGINRYDKNSDPVYRADAVGYSEADDYPVPVACNSPGKKSARASL